ncbi:MAG: LacI family transcriptional regulator [Syntrophomonadaceae bacterium]|nr:LacI family transcriptional regulator [Syntrophomonadaceae bacterium]
MKKNLTQEDIAIAAGVSRATVSYVLTGKKKVSKETTDKVLKIAASYGYLNTRLKKSGKDRAKNSFIGFLVLPNWVNPNEDYFVFAIQQGINTMLKKSGHRLVYNRLETFEEADVPELLNFVKSVKGLIILNPGNGAVYENFMEWLHSRGVHHVLIGSPNDEDTYYVDMDVVSSGYQCASKLLSKGCKNIVYIDSHKEMKQSSQILKGFHLAHEERELQWIEENVIHVEDSSIEEGMRLAHSVIASGKKVDGFVTPNDILARGVIIALQQQQIKIPEEIKIVSLGGGVISSQISYPRISAVDYKPYQMGMEAAEMLMEIISKKRMRSTHSIFPATLIERETS